MSIGSSKVAWKGFLSSLLHYFQDFEGASLARNLFYIESRLLPYANYETFLYLACHSDIFSLSSGISQRILCTLNPHSKVFVSRPQAV